MHNRMPSRRRKGATRKGPPPQGNTAPVEKGDTDKGPVLDETYEKLRERPADPDKKFSP